MYRIYDSVLQQHFRENRQMLFLAGPRQVGKTTAARSFSADPAYFNWDNEDHRQLILQGPAGVFEHLGTRRPQTVIFDELHKHADWQNFLKGFFDTYSSEDLRIITTGSARLDIFRKGADGLTGRYFLYHMHPLTVGELASPAAGAGPINHPRPITADDFAALKNYSGFPEPYIKRSARFYNQWKQQRRQILFRQEVHDLTQIQDLRHLELLAELLRQQVGGVANYSSLAVKVRASDHSIRNWLGVLESLYYCYTVRPWSRNIGRSLLKDPKLYLWDWSAATDEGARAENLVASHLLKAVHWWQDCGLGEHGLHYLRTKDGREVDFLVSKDGQPWFLVEVKSSSRQDLSPHLAYFQHATGAAHAFQVCLDGDYEDADCFRVRHPVKVPALTFLSQLV
jgi:predicted AAA+ superfamily ATPase